MKVIAPLAGFSWRNEDAGGDESQLRYRVAIGPESPEREEARGWLLSYNADDVRATAALREWLDSTVTPVASIADLDPPPVPSS